MVLVLALLLVSVVPMGPPLATAQEDGPSGPWTVPVRVDSGPSRDRAIGSVRLAVGPDGGLFSAWLEDRDDGTDCFVAGSSDLGDSWREDIRVDPLPNQLRQVPTTCDVGADDDGHVYATYSQWIGLQGWWRVRFARSDDGGATFRDPSDAFPMVDDTVAQEHPTLAISAAGSLSLLYLERTSTSSKLFVVRSDDGLNPQPPRAVEAGMPENVSHVQGDMVLGDDGTLYIAYGYRSTSEAGIKVATRAAGAGSFAITKIYSVTEDTPRFLRPSIAVYGEDVIEVVFDPLEADGHILHLRSSDGGVTFDPPRQVWSTLQSGDVQTNPQPAFDKMGRVHMVWTQGGRDPKRVLHSFSVDGVSFTAPTEVAGSWDEEEMGTRMWEDDAVPLLLSNGDVAVAFSAHLNTSVGVYFARLVNLPPVVEITAPADGAEVRGDISIQGTADDPGGITGISSIFVKVGTDDPNRLPGATVWEINLNTERFEDGYLTIRVWATDGFLTGLEDAITVDVDNNVRPQLNLARPENATTYVGTVPVVGTAHDKEGFGDNRSVQWRVHDSDPWQMGLGLVLQDAHNLDFDFELDLSEEPSGPSQIHVRVSDGDKFSAVQSRTFTLNNRPDLAVSSSSIELDVVQPEHKELVIVVLTVTNTGVVPSGAYDVSFENYNKPIDFVSGSNLSAGESENLQFSWEAQGGTNKLRFTLDPRFKIEELSKDNNLAELVVEVPKPPEEDGGGLSPLMMGIIVVVIIGAVGAGVLAWRYMPRGPRPPTPTEEVVVYEGGGLYDDASGPYAGGQAPPRPPAPGEGQGGGTAPPVEQFQPPQGQGPGGVVGEGTMEPMQGSGQEPPWRRGPGRKG